MPPGQIPEAYRKPTDYIGDRIASRMFHPEWVLHQARWRFLLDSYEGGERYRQATYGSDRKGLPVRNLFRHRREYPDQQEYPNILQGTAGSAVNPGSAAIGATIGTYPGVLGADPAATAQDDDYELRRSRTPVPEFVSEAVEIHLGKIYDQEVSRTGPDWVAEWWADVDNTGMPIDEWIREVLAPLLLVLGCVDVCFDRPQMPPGIEIVTREDEVRYRQDQIAASIILPENMVWWRSDRSGAYLECLVKEYVDASDRNDWDEKGNAIEVESDSEPARNWRRNFLRYRYWDSEQSILYNQDGEQLEGSAQPHPYGRVPIVRLIDVPRQRTPMIGKSRYESIAEIQREFYNRSSELILSDVLQSSPLLSGPEDFCKADQTISIGPGFVLPMKKNPENGQYAGWEYISPPKDPAATIRQNMMDLIDAKDRRASLTKPAGTPGTTGGTVAQSGISKQLDAVSGNKVLSAIAKTLARAERKLAEYAFMCKMSRPPNPKERAEILIQYPNRFQLYAAEELLQITQLFQQCLANLALPTTSSSPTLEGELLLAAARSVLVGLPDATYQDIEKEIEFVVQINKTLPIPGIVSTAEVLKGAGTAEAAAGTDPTGQTAATRVTNPSPAVI